MSMGACTFLIMVGNSSLLTHLITNSRIHSFIRSFAYSHPPSQPQTLAHSPLFHLLTHSTLTLYCKFQLVSWRRGCEGSREATGVGKRLIDVPHEVDLGGLLPLGFDPHHWVVKQIETDNRHIK